MLVIIIFLFSCFFISQLYEGSALHSAYQHHLSTSLHCYQQLSADLERKFGQSASSIAALQGTMLRVYWFVSIFFLLKSEYNLCW